MKDIEKQIMKDKIDVTLNMYLHTHRKEISQYMQDSFDSALEKFNLKSADVVTVVTFENILAKMQEVQSKIIFKAITEVLADVFADALAGRQESDEDFD